MKYLLDTNICITLLNGRDKSLAKKIKFLSCDDLKLCSVVKAELLFGARNSQKIDFNLRLLQDFFAPFESLPFDDDASQFYGVVRAVLAKAGTPIGSNDLMIGSIAQTHQLTLVTRNQDEFTRIPGLAVEVW